MINQPSLQPLTRALEALDRAIQQPKDEFTRDAVIQRFEFSYELCWKTLKRYLAQAERPRFEGIFIKEIFRFAGEVGLIDDVEIWFRFHEARNLASHTYNEAQAEKVYELSPVFLECARQLVARLQSHAP